MPLLLLMMMVLVMMMIEDCQDVVMMWAYVGVALVEMRMVVMSFTRYYDDDVQDAESCGGPDEDDVMATMTVFSILIMMMMTPMTTMVIIMAVPTVMSKAKIHEMRSPSRRRRSPARDTRSSLRCAPANHFVSSAASRDVFIAWRFSEGDALKRAGAANMCLLYHGSAAMWHCSTE